MGWNKDGVRRTYNYNSQIEFKITMPNLRLKW